MRVTTMRGSRPNRGTFYIDEANPGIKKPRNSAPTAINSLPPYHQPRAAKQHASKVIFQCII